MAVFQVTPDAGACVLSYDTGHWNANVPIPASTRVSKNNLILLNNIKLVEAVDSTWDANETSCVNQSLHLNFSV